MIRVEDFRIQTPLPVFTVIFRLRFRFVAPPPVPPFVFPFSSGSSLANPRRPRRSWLLPDLAGSFPFDTVIAAILATQGNLHSTNFIRFLKCGRGRARRAQGVREGVCSKGGPGM